MWRLLIGFAGLHVHILMIFMILNTTQCTLLPVELEQNSLCKCARPFLSARFSAGKGVATRDYPALGWVGVDIDRCMM